MTTHATATSRHLRLECRDEVYTLTLDHDERRNALAEPMLRDIADALEQVGESGARGLVLAAQGRVFSAGHDFSDVASRDADGVGELLRLCTDVMQTLHRLPQVVIARVHAPAIAAGCQLALSADLAVAAEDAGFSLPGGKGGWFCHTPSVPVAGLVSPKRLMYMAMSGEMIDARTAESWGLINAAVPAGELDDTVAQMMELTTRGSRESKAWGKRTLYEHLGGSEDEAYATAVPAMTAASQLPDAREGMQAFLDKRTPVFGA